MANLGTLEELKSWKDYHVFMKERLKQLPDTDCPFFISKEKIDFSVDGKPWTGYAVLAGTKGEIAVKRIKKEGVLFRQGSASLDGKAFTVEGLSSQYLKRARITLKKLKLGYTIAGLTDDADEIEETEAPTPPAGVREAADDPPPASPAAELTTRKDDVVTTIREAAALKEPANADILKKAAAVVKAIESSIAKADTKAAGNALDLVEDLLTGLVEGPEPADDADPDLAGLADWAAYRDFLKVQLKRMPKEGGPFYITRKKVEFTVAGKPYKNFAVLVGKEAKLKPTLQAFKKEGVMVHEGTCVPDGKKLMVSGIDAAWLKGAVKLFMKLKLGRKVVAGSAPAPAAGSPDKGASKEAAEFEKIHAAASKILTELKSSHPSGEVTSLDKLVAGLKITIDKALTSPVDTSEVVTKGLEKGKQFLKEAAELKKRATTSKADYDKAYAAAKADVEKADAANHNGFYALKKVVEKFDKAHGVLKKLVAASDWGRALIALDKVTPLAKEVNDAFEAFRQYNIYRNGKGKDVGDYLENLNNSTPVKDTWKTELYAYRDLLRKFHAGKFEDALKDLKALAPKLDDLKKKVDTYDTEAKKKNAAAEKEIMDLVKGENFSSLDDDEAEELIKKLKKKIDKLKPDKQRQLLEDLHGPIAKLTPEQRIMQRAIYRSLKLDKDFLKADKRVQEATKDELKKDPELQDAVADWNKKKADGTDVVDLTKKKAMVEKVLAAQCKSYGMTVPAVNWYDVDDGNFGYFSADSGILSLNTKYLHDVGEMVNTVLHENAHNYQDQLARKFADGEIKKSDPLYEQARTFAAFHHWDAYVEPDEDGEVYALQPEEGHAWHVGDTGSPAVMKALAKERKKRLKAAKKKSK